MGMVVRTNVMAVNANRQLGMNNTQVGNSLEKLASGFRINRAGDDASGLAISEKMKAQIKGLETASANAQDGISLIQTAEGALTEVHDMLNRMVELAGKSANGTMDDNVDRAALQKEVEALKSEINRIAQGTNFNGIKLLDGSMGSSGPAITSAPGGTTEPGFSAGTPDPSGSKDILSDFDFTGDVDLDDIKAEGEVTIGDITLDLGTLSGSGTLAGTDVIGLVSEAFNQAISEHNTTGAGGTATYNEYSAPDVVANGTNGLTISFTTTEHTYNPGGTTPATTTIDFTGKTGADLIGTTLTVDGDTYEFVLDAGDVADGNTAIVIASDANAGAIATAAEGVLGGSLVGNTVVLEASGSDPAPQVTAAGGGLTLQIGDTADAFNKVSISVGDMSTVGLGIDTLSVADQTAASQALAMLKNSDNAANGYGAINVVSTVRADLGALQNRLDHTINNLDVAAENMTAANSRIRDTDMAKQMMEYTKMNVLSQAAQAMLAQANSSTQSVLQLLR